jgi:tRNA (uracil-5-)-methyltransferase
MTFINQDETLHEMVDPKCRYFGKCGGCTAQHIPYEVQLENKKNIVSHATGLSDIKVFHDYPYSYRSRMDFIFHKHGLGFREKGNWKTIIDIAECAISNAKLNSILHELRSFFDEPDYFDLVKKTGTMKYAVIRTPGGKSSISFVLNDKSTRLKEVIDQVKSYAEKSSADNIIITYASPEQDVSTSTEFFLVKGTDTLSETFLGKIFSFNVQGFFQNNSKVAEKMLAYSRQLLEKYDTKDAHLLDLYGGVGTFGIVNSDLFRMTTVVEAFKGSIDSAKENIAANKARADAYALDAKQIRRLKLGDPLFVIADPPRSGMEQGAINSLKEFRPNVIIYVSCNPQQLKKDLQKFNGYEVRSAAMFDMFPQTTHVEAVAELIRC